MKSSLGSPKTLFRNNLSKAQLQKLLLIWPGIIVLLGLVAYPLGSILLQSLYPKLFDVGFSQFSLQSFRTILQTSYTYKSILNALLFGGGSAVLSAVFGTFFALMVYRKRIYGDKIIGLLVWLIFFTPSYLIAEGWVLMMSHKGIMSEVFSIPDGRLDWFFSPGGVIAAMALRLFPVVYLSVLNGLRGLGSDYEEAARTLGARTLLVQMRIIVPLLLPSILAGATLAFAESVSDFGFATAIVPQAHIPMLTYSIFAALNLMPVDYSQVGALSIVLIGIIAFALWCQRLILGRGNYSIIKNQIRPFHPRGSKSYFWSIVSFLFIVIALVIPLGGEVCSSFMNNSVNGFVGSNFTLHNYTAALSSGSKEFQSILRSLELSSITAVVATLFGVILAFVILRDSGFVTRILYVMTMSTLAIPGIVLAAGYVFGWNAPYLVPLHLNMYGTLFCVFLAYLAGSMPSSIRLQIASITQISPSLLSAGQVHGAGIFTLFRKILLPLVAGTCISTLFLIFSHLMFELPVSELLYPPAQSLLPVVIVHSYNEFQIEKGSALTVLSIILVLLVFGLGQLLIYGVRKWSKWNTARYIQRHVPVDNHSVLAVKPHQGLANQIESER
jgi:iron(III) transport system permease protein